MGDAHGEGLELRLVTLAMAVYGQPKMLNVWLETLRSYPEEVLDQLELIVVDDCGSPPAEIPMDIQDLLPVQVFRVTEDIPWNQPGARNLAMDHVRTPIVLFVDPDMVFPAEMMALNLEAAHDLPEGRIIRFSLQHRSGPGKGSIDTTSPNTWFCHVSDFLLVHGYDEDYCGHKGWSDVQLLDIMTSAFKISHTKKLYAQFYSDTEVSDAMVSSLDRNTKHNRYMRLGKHRKAALCGGWVKFSQRLGNRIRFKWEQVL